MFDLSSLFTDLFQVLKETVIEVFIILIPIFFKIFAPLFGIKVAFDLFQFFLDRQDVSEAYDQIVLEQEQYNIDREQAFEELCEQMPEEWFDGGYVDPYSLFEEETIDVSEWESMRFHEIIDSEEVDELLQNSNYYTYEEDFEDE